VEEPLGWAALSACPQTWCLSIGIRLCRASGGDLSAGIFPEDYSGSFIQSSLLNVISRLRLHKRENSIGY
jgi:hypothetical protein